MIAKSHGTLWKDSNPREGVIQYRWLFAKRPKLDSNPREGVIQAETARFYSLVEDSNPREGVIPRRRWLGRARQIDSNPREGVILMFSFVLVTRYWRIQTPVRG